MWYAHNFSNQQCKKTCVAFRAVSLKQYVYIHVYVPQEFRATLYALSYLIPLTCLVAQKARTNRNAAHTSNANLGHAKYCCGAELTSSSLVLEVLVHACADVGHHGISVLS